MSQDHNHLNHATWECKYHVVFTPKYRTAYADIDPAQIFGGGGDRVSEGESSIWIAQNVERAAQFSWSQILGEGLLRFDRRAG
jgi:hypothetical protein